MTAIQIVLVTALVLISFAMGFGLGGYFSAWRDVPVPQPHEPPHARYCERDDDVWKCEERCAWRAWKVELANRELVPPGSPNLRIVK